MPHRIQRKRTKGWRMPEGAVYVGRPTIWGNPFTAVQAREAGYQDGNTMAVHAFRCMLAGDQEFVRSHEHQAHMILDGIHKIRGKDLVCWCPLVDQHDNSNVERGVGHVDDSREIHDGSSQ